MEEVFYGLSIREMKASGNRYVYSEPNHCHVQVEWWDIAGKYVATDSSLSKLSQEICSFSLGSLFCGSIFPAKFSPFLEYQSKVSKKLVSVISS